MWYLPLCLYTLRQFSSFRRSQSPPFFSWLFIFFFSRLSRFWIYHLGSSTLQYSDHHCEELSLMIFFFFSYLSSHSSSIPLPPARPVLSRFSSLQPGACCAALDCDGAESWFSLFNQLSYFFSLFQSLFYYVLLFPLIFTPLASCCISSEAVCRCFAVRGQLHRWLAAPPRSIITEVEHWGVSSHHVPLLPASLLSLSILLFSQSACPSFFRFLAG